MTAKVIALARPAQRVDEISDEALVAACAVGDETALRILYRRHNEAVYRFACRTLGAARSHADDVVQQVFLTAWDSAHRFKGRSAVRSWLFGIAANLARAHHRKQARRAGLFERFSSVPEEPPVTTDERLGLKQDLVRLKAAVEDLPHDLRVAFVMCEIEEIPGTEAARALGVRPGTIWRRLHEARRALRKALEETSHG